MRYLILIIRNPFNDCNLIPEEWVCPGKSHRSSSWCWCQGFPWPFASLCHLQDDWIQRNEGLMVPNWNGDFCVLFDYTTGLHAMWSLLNYENAQFTEKCSGCFQKPYSNKQSKSLYGCDVISIYHHHHHQVMAVLAERNQKYSDQCLLWSVRVDFFLGTGP